ncbi:crotonobetainyl-CoA:carnitine CoA-transferase CaiB-like acyl-CoA transferase [Pseudomonas sp. SJZ103]|uniref:CaiB/BaiF CoA transferase family protein n=1 Tax=unclassified Pseudomonas TaxID=196821 RepID=UPI0011A29879|nr:MULTISPECIES: CoA transferase [unclassified Pseudomonas]TWC63131.1 crotonobetainyl-CoA:carnitine CoA-transferase CaiB-like acyl-CoA transferase [Pseudomonas sp. SJZ103]TWC80180.1 crotonobetainyl-CoA:carnitine CoA-transferase CaiB-like acyl-CoA transferase [Pseudomonas sp. SJZ094]
MKPSLLNDLRVVDMTTVIFGPYCTQILADLGADVVKVEPDKIGDASRNIGKSAKTAYMGPLHLRLNRGKRSVVWDLKSSRGREAFERLLAKSDIFIHNIRPDAVGRANLDYETVRKLRPDIIYVHCTGFDTVGPYSGRPAYDDIIQAASGAASLLPRVDGNPAPRFIPMAFADKVSGLHAVYAVMAAVIHRIRTGEGQYVEVPMLESIASFNLLEHLYERTFDPAIGSTGYARQLDPSRQPMQTKDGYIVIAPYQDGRWLKFLELSGLSHVLEEPGLTTLMERRTNADRLYRYMAQVLPEKTTADWLALLSEHQIPASNVNTIDDLLDDPQLKASGLFTLREHPTEGRYTEVGQPVRFSAVERVALRDAPTIGQHTEEISRELGLDWQ